MTRVLAAILVLIAFDASPCQAQTRITSLEDLRLALEPGDSITVVLAQGGAVAGRVIRLGRDELDLRLAGKRTDQDRRPLITIPLNTIRSLERPRDSARNGAAWGAVAGAGTGGTMFLVALVTDRNEIDEWGPAYAGATAICTGIGALIGWAVDAAYSKPHLRFDSSHGARPAVRVRPLYSPGYGVGLAVSVSR